MFSLSSLLIFFLKISLVYLYWNLNVHSLLWILFKIVKPGNYGNKLQIYCVNFLMLSFQHFFVLSEVIQ